MFLDRYPRKVQPSSTTTNFKKKKMLERKIMETLFWERDKTQVRYFQIFFVGVWEMEVLTPENMM